MRLLGGQHQVMLISGRGWYFYQRIGTCTVDYLRLCPPLEGTVCRPRRLGHECLRALQPVDSKLTGRGHFAIGDSRGSCT